MTELTTCASRILHKYEDNSFFILVYVDFDELLSKDYILNYIKSVVNKNRILRQHIIERGDILFLEDVKQFDINDYYRIENEKCENFDNHIGVILNDVITTDSKWRCAFYLDEASHKTRFYFKIHHAYVDGSQLTKMLMSPFNECDVTKKFNRTTGLFGTLYYYFIGTILLFFTNIRCLIGILFKKYEDENETKVKNTDTDYIICKALNFNEIKQFTKEHNITINDFLYSLMVKTDNLYRKKVKILTTMSPINVSGVAQTNNMCPVVNIIKNSHDGYGLLNIVHETFNNFKYSLFIPILNFIINHISPYIHLDVLTCLSNRAFKNSDYIYSNIIGPTIDYSKIKVRDIHFLIASKNREIVYNIVSYSNNINVLCSFKKGVIKDKARFEKCIYDAYDNLLSHRKKR